MNRRITAAHIAALVTAALGLSACVGADDRRETGAIEAGLRQIPMSVVDRARDDFDTADVEIVDVASLAELRGLATPGTGRDGAEVNRWIAELRGTFADGPEVDAALWSDIFNQMARDGGTVALDEQFGLDAGAITAYSAMVQPPEPFVVLSGDDSVASTLVDVGGGVLSTFEGDDGEVDPDQSNPFDTSGRPTRVGQIDDAVALSGRTGDIEDWLGEGESAADDPNLLEAARALDEHDVVSANLATGDFDFDVRDIVGFTATDERMEEMLERVAPILLPVPFDAIGFGGTEIEGDVALVAVYVFADESDARDARGALEGLWSTGETFAMSEPIGTVVDLVSVEGLWTHCHRDRRTPRRRADGTRLRVVQPPQRPLRSRLNHRRASSLGNGFTAR